MDWKGEVKPRNVRLAEDLHRRIKSAGSRMGLGVEESYQAALECWLREQGQMPDQPDDERKSREEFTRFRSMLAEAKADSSGTAASILNILRERYGEFSTPVPAKAKGKK